MDHKNGEKDLMDFGHEMMLSAEVFACTNPLHSQLWPEIEKLYCEWQLSRWIMSYVRVQMSMGNMIERQQ